MQSTTGQTSQHVPQSSQSPSTTARPSPNRRASLGHRSTHRPHPVHRVLRIHGCGRRRSAMPWTKAIGHNSEATSEGSRDTSTSSHSLQDVQMASTDSFRSFSEPAGHTTTHSPQATHARKSRSGRNLRKSRYKVRLPGVSFYSGLAGPVLYPPKLVRGVLEFLVVGDDDGLTYAPLAQIQLS